MAKREFNLTNAMKMVSSIEDMCELSVFKRVLKSQEDIVTMRDMVKKFGEGYTLGAEVEFWEYREKEELRGTIIGIVGRRKFRIECTSSCYEVHYRDMLRVINVMN